ncbi:MAG: nodulation protein NfeD [Alphaproteobacteria bacterium]|nr:nodulation protein NfeD [Alphaproteobacteria bacterium]
MATRFVHLVVLVAAAFVMLLPARAQSPTVGVLTIEDAIGPATAAYVERGLRVAEEVGHAAVVLEIDTPGGLSTAMRDIVEAILASDVPVLGYVAPQGARAASAGAYILMATHVAAMAPATNVGAATPVQMGGGSPLPGGGPGGGEGGDADGAGDGDESANGDGDGDGGAEGSAPGDATRAKAINDAVAYFRSLAELRDRNVEWAERAVREAASLSATAALEKNVIDAVAADRAELLAFADGRTVELAGERRATVAVADARTVAIEPNWQERLLAVLANPNVAYILMLVGIYGIIFELANPGTIGSGVVGAISLLLGLFALNLLPIDYAGVGLILLGVVLMVGEALTPSVGILGIGGVIAFILGSVLLIDTNAPGFALSPWVIGAVTASTAGLLMGVLTLAIKALRGPVVSGGESLSGQVGRVVAWEGDHGTLHVAGENWHAVGPRNLRAGQPARVERREGLTLTVSPVEDHEEST